MPLLRRLLLDVQFLASYTYSYKCQKVDIDGGHRRRARGGACGASRRDEPCAAPARDGACGLSRRDRRWTLPWPRPTTSCFESASGASACGSRARASSARTGCSASRSTRSGKARWRWCAQVRPRGVAVSLQRGEEVCDGSNKFISTGRRPADCDQSTRDAAAKAIAEASAGPPKTQPDHPQTPTRRRRRRRRRRARSRHEVVVRVVVRDLRPTCARRG